MARPSQPSGLHLRLTAVPFAWPPAPMKLVLLHWMHGTSLPKFSSVLLSASSADLEPSCLQMQPSPWPVSQAQSSVGDGHSRRQRLQLPMAFIRLPTTKHRPGRTPRTSFGGLGRELGSLDQTNLAGYLAASARLWPNEACCRRAQKVWRLWGPSLILWRVCWVPTTASFGSARSRSPRYVIEERGRI